MTFKQGDLLVFNPKKASLWAAKPGALAVVTKSFVIYDEVSLVTVEWVCRLGRSQMDGEYYSEDFIPVEMGGKNNEDFL